MKGERIALALVLVAALTFVVSGEAIQYTSTLEFCATSCHEMDVVVAEYKVSPHYRNASGVRATCADCHIPKHGVEKLIRKASSINELYHKLLGTIDTPEKFAKRRDLLAQRVIDEMRSNDSRECRSCHQYEAMDHGIQREMSIGIMTYASEENITCIECHQGIAHTPLAEVVPHHETS